MTDYTWDPRKAAANRRKHGVTFEEGQTVLRDPLARTVPDELHSDEEERYRTLGQSATGAILIVVHTRPDGGPGRIISVRKARPRERRDYGGQDEA